MLNVVFGLGELLRFETEFPLARYDHWYLPFVASGFCTKPEVSYTLLGSGLWLVMLGYIHVEIVCSLQDKKWISVLLDTGELRL